MVQTIGAKIHKFVSLHNDGTITASELTNALCNFVIESRDFFQHLDCIPPEVLTELRRIAERAPAHPEDCLIIQGITEGPDFDWESYDLGIREGHYWASRRLREHFFPELPMPQFEKMKFAGKVDEVRELDGSVVILGEFSSYLIRKHPIRLKAPNGQIMITSVTAERLIGVDRSATPKQYGELGLWLGHNVKSAEDVAIGTEVWVDRSNVGEPIEPPCTGAAAVSQWNDG